MPKEINFWHFIKMNEKSNFELDDIYSSVVNTLVGKPALL